MDFSFKSLFAIWSLSPQRFHYYFFLSIVSWQYQKYWTILILVLCLLCVTALVFSSYSSFTPSSPFFNSWWQKIVSYVHIHLLSNVLHRRRRVSPRRPYRCLQMKCWAAVTVVAIPFQKALLMCPYVSSGKFWVLAPCCFRALLHHLQLISDRCLIFASHLATGPIPAIAIISRLLCLQGTRGSFKYFPEIALLSFCRNMKSAVHVPYAGWLI